MATPERVYTDEWEDYLRTYNNKPQSTVAIPTGQGSILVTKTHAEKLYNQHKNSTPQAYNTVDVGVRAINLPREEFERMQEILEDIFYEEPEPSSE